MRGSSTLLTFCAITSQFAISLKTEVAWVVCLPIMYQDILSAIKMFTSPLSQKRDLRMANNINYYISSDREGGENECF